MNRNEYYKQFSLIVCYSFIVCCSIKSFSGDIYYKDAAQDSISGALQLGITHSIGSHQSDRDVLIQDFQIIETIQFPKTGTTVTPSHNFDDFR